MRIEVCSPTVVGIKVNALLIEEYLKSGKSDGKSDLELLVLKNAHHVVQLIPRLRDLESELGISRR